MTLEERVTGRRIGILGMARSGMAVARLAARHGAKLLVSDSADENRLAAQVKELSSTGIPFEVGGHTEALLQCDYLVLSPGVPLDLEIIKRARDKGIPLFSEIEFASWFCQGKIVAITGANGKTTTTTLIGAMLAEARLPVRVAGNIGQPFAAVAEDLTPESWAVLEISSFQLETIADFKPHIAAILNISPDHLDRHGTIDAYREAKYRLTENQDENDYLILNRDDQTLSTQPPKTNATTLYFTTGHNEEAACVQNNQLCLTRNGVLVPVLPVDDISMFGKHNLENAAAAALTAALCEVPNAAIAKVLRTFPGVEHRLEKVDTVAGITFVNDSKATNVESVAVALRAMSAPVWLILGGRDKGAGYAPIATAGQGKVRGIVAIGEAREKVFHELGKSFPVEFADSLPRAVRRCFELASPGDTVLLSPGCASFDMFDNFEHRGQVFKEAVKSLRNGRKKNE
ncbi:MAG: UDP-N-acetylmuramoyl-L-alanine--D-glutamate ligase, partial [Candidatus Zixiibacteriota bacterium]